MEDVIWVPLRQNKEVQQQVAREEFVRDAEEDHGQAGGGMLGIGRRGKVSSDGLKIGEDGLEVLRDLSETRGEEAANKVREDGGTEAVIEVDEDGESGAGCRIGGGRQLEGKGGGVVGGGTVDEGDRGAEVIGSGGAI